MNDLSSPVQRAGPTPRPSEMPPPLNTGDLQSNPSRPNSRQTPTAAGIRSTPHSRSKHHYTPKLAQMVSIGERSDLDTSISLQSKSSTSLMTPFILNLHESVKTERSSIPGENECSHPEIHALCERYTTYANVLKRIEATLVSSANAFVLERSQRMESDAEEAMRVEFATVAGPVHAKVLACKKKIAVCEAEAARLLAWKKDVVDNLDAMLASKQRSVRDMHANMKKELNDLQNAQERLMNMYMRQKQTTNDISNLESLEEEVPSLVVKNNTVANEKSEWLQKLHDALILREARKKEEQARVDEIRNATRRDRLRGESVKRHITNAKKAEQDTHIELKRVRRRCHTLEQSLAEAQDRIEDKRSHALRTHTPRPNYDELALHDLGIDRTKLEGTNGVYDAMQKKFLQLSASVRRAQEERLRLATYYVPLAEIMRFASPMEQKVQKNDENIEPFGGMDLSIPLYLATPLALIPNERWNVVTAERHALALLQGMAQKFRAPAGKGGTDAAVSDDRYVENLVMETLKHKRIDPAHHMHNLLRAAECFAHCSPCCDLILGVLDRRFPPNYIDHAASVAERVLSEIILSDTSGSGATPVKTAFGVLTKEYQSLRLGYLESMQARFALLKDSASDDNAVRHQDLTSFSTSANRQEGLLFRTVMWHAAQLHKHVYCLIEDATLAVTTSSVKKPREMVLSESSWRQSLAAIRWDSNLTSGTKFARQNPRMSTIHPKLFADQVTKGLTRHEGKAHFPTKSIHRGSFASARRPDHDAGPQVHLHRASEVDAFGGMNERQDLLDARQVLALIRTVPLHVIEATGHIFSQEEEPDDIY